MDPEKIEIVAKWKHSSPLLSCRIDPAGVHVFAGAEDRSIQRWNLQSGEVTAFNGHQSWVRALAFHADSGTLLSGGFDGRLNWWEVDAKRPEPRRSIDTGHGWVRAVAVSPDGTLVATAGNDRLVKLWSFQSGELLGLRHGHESHVYNVVFQPRQTGKGQVFASADLKGVVRHWEIGSDASRRTLDASALHNYDKTFLADIGGARSMAFSADGRFLACGGIADVTNAFAGIGNPCVVLLDWESGEVKQKHVPGKKDLKGVAWGVVFHPEGFLVGASGGGGGFLLFWKPGEATEFFQFKLPNEARDLDLHPDGMRLVTAHHDGHVRVSRLG